MQVIQLTNEDIVFIREKYPELNYSPEENIIRGLFYFCRHYQDERIDSIYDCYQIEINLNKLINNTIPSIMETAGRIKEIARVKKKDLADLHLNTETGEMCLIIPPKIKEKFPNGFNLHEYLNIVESHLYWISHYEKFDKPPWPAMEHGDDGYFQLFFKNKEFYYKDYKKYFAKYPWKEYWKKFKDYKKRKKL